VVCGRPYIRLFASWETRRLCSKKLQWWQATGSTVNRYFAPSTNAEHETGQAASTVCTNFAMKQPAIAPTLSGLRPIYTEELPGVAVHDSLFVLLHPGVAVPNRARAQNYPTQQNKQRITPVNSWHVLSVQTVPLRLRQFVQWEQPSNLATLSRSCQAVCEFSAFC